MCDGTYYMNHPDDKTFLCVFDFPDQPGKGIFDKARDKIMGSLSSPSQGRTVSVNKGAL
jgi:hypothetical protein